MARPAQIETPRVASVRLIGAETRTDPAPAPARKPSPGNQSGPAHHLIPGAALIVVLPVDDRGRE